MPAHVKFLFATTEVDKLPVTVLSRCQRFDLRRIPKELLERQFAAICRAEGVEAEPEALAIIASAAEGSSRDGLSILDQAIAHADLDAGGKVTAERVRDYKPSMSHFRFFARSTGARKENWIHVARSWHHDISPARELDLPRIWVDRDNTGEDPSAASVRVTSAVELSVAIASLRS